MNHTLPENVIFIFQQRVFQNFLLP